MRRRIALRTAFALTASLGLAGCNLIFGIQDGTLDDGAGGGGTGGASGPGGPSTTTQSGTGQGGGGGSPTCAGVPCDDSEPCTDDMCVDGECEHVPALAPDLTAMQTPGDCLAFACVGDPPKAQEVVDDADVPSADTDDCTDDVCDEGTPYPFSAAFTPCVLAAPVVGECDGAGTCVPDECVPSQLLSGARIGPNCGVFVSPGSSGTGTRSSPTGDLTAALGAVAMGQSVYLCGGGSFTGNFSAKPNTNIYGGLNCDWTAEVANVPTLSGSTPGQPTLLVQNGTSRLEGIGIVGASVGATGGGLPSIALMVDQANLSIRFSVIEGGTAGDGQDGSSMLNNPSTGGDGGNGLVQVCGNTADTRGQFGTSACGNQGGFGGDGGVIGGTPATGFAGATGQGTAPGGGGSGETTSAACSAGQPGSPGTPGAIGLGGTGDGSLNGGFQPAPPPAPGTVGTHGSGGGGGGGDGGFGLSCTPSPGRAGGGGGGGGAGCRGAGGGGGHGGGASFAIVALGSNITIELSTLRASAAGRGGNGAQGELGSAGGAGGSKATGSGACAGGAGGAGGHGGPGGGGPGGPAALVARVGGSVAFAVGTALQLPGQAFGGSGATTGTLTGGTGAAGTVCDELVYVPPSPSAMCIDH